MAPNALIFLTIFSAFTFTSLFGPTLSQTLPETTTVLDVSATLSQAREVLSSDPESTKPLGLQQDQIHTNSSTISFQLHPRAALHNSQHQDYKSLILSRLDRDSARVDSLHTKLQLVLQGVKKIDLEPVDTEIRPEDLNTPVVSGVSQGSGEYFTRIGVGTPAKPFYMVLDTGSDVNWLQCNPCTDCYQQSDPIFDPAGSASYSPLTCDSPLCESLEVSACRDDKCLYQVSYGDGSYTIGSFVTETLSFGRSGAIKDVALGCGHDNEGLFVAAAGLLGLGGGPLSLTSQFKATSFSYCLVDRDSSASSTLEFNSAPPVDSVTTPLIRSSKLSTFYYVGLTGFSVGGRQIPIRPEIFQLNPDGRGGIIVDSGTAITRLQTEAYNSLRDAFKRLTRDLPGASSFSLFDTCYDLKSQTTVKVPTMSFLFGGGKALPLPAKNYLIPVDSSGTFCFAFAPMSSELSIIGNVQQQGTRVSYDLANHQVGFAANKC